MTLIWSSGPNENNCWECAGAKDNLVKLWDAKTGRELCTLYGLHLSLFIEPLPSFLPMYAYRVLIKSIVWCRHGHKNTVLSVKWNSNGNWVLTASRDQTIKVVLPYTTCLQSYWSICYLCYVGVFVDEFDVMVWTGSSMMSERSRNWRRTVGTERKSQVYFVSFDTFCCYHFCC